MNDPTRRPTNNADQSPSPESDRFDAAFRAWASRPPATPPARAARRVAEHLPPRTRFPELRRLAVAAALVAALGAALALLRVAVPGEDITRSPSDLAATAPDTTTALPAPDDDVLVIALDPQTNLYLNLSEPNRPDRPVRD